MLLYRSNSSRQNIVLSANVESKATCVWQITQLKIDNNPFAKGFRDSGGGKREKKLASVC